MVEFVEAVIPRTMFAPIIFLYVSGLIVSVGVLLCKHMPVEKDEPGNVSVNLDVADLM